MPDIFIKWNRAKRMASVQSERLGRIEIDFFPARTGDHQVDGLVLSNREIPQERNISVLDLRQRSLPCTTSNAPNDGAGRRSSHRANG